MKCSRSTLPLPSSLFIPSLTLSLSLSLSLSHSLLSSSHSMPYLIATGPPFPDEPILVCILLPFTLCYLGVFFVLESVILPFGTIVLFSIYVLSFRMLFRFKVFEDCCYGWRDVWTCGMYDTCCYAVCGGCGEAGVNTDGSARNGERWNVT
jgi:hypothetical protein